MVSTILSSGIPKIIPVNIEVIIKATNVFNLKYIISANKINTPITTLISGQYSPNI